MLQRINRSALLYYYENENNIRCKKTPNKLKTDTVELRH